MDENIRILSPQAPPAANTRATVALLRGASRPARRARLLRKLALYGVVLLLAGGAYSLTPLFKKVEAPRRTIAVRKRTIAPVLHEIGSISAHVERPVLAKFSGEITWRAEDGMHVEAGDPVVIFDSKMVQEDIDARHKELIDKQDAVRLAEAAIENTKRRYSFVIRQREIDFEKAKVAHKKSLEYPRPDDLMDVELNWRNAELDLRLCELQTTGMIVLTQQGFNSEAALRKKQLELANSKVEFARSKTIYDLTRQGQTADQKRVAEMAVADAQKLLNVTKFNRDADLTTGQATLELAKLALEDYERDFNRRKSHLDAATVRAPMTGRVIFQSIYRSDRRGSPIQVGESRSEGQDLCMLLDTSHLVITLWINEMDIGAVRLNQRATVTLPALPGRTLEAEVSEIAVTAQDKNAALSWLALRRAGEAFVNVVRIKLAFINLPQDIKNHVRVGFTADVKLDLGSSGMALCVPWQAIGHSPDGAPFADVETGGKLERRPLKLGRSDNDCVEVLEGLSENMLVVDHSNAAIPLRENDGQPETTPPRPGIDTSGAPRVSEERP